ncbi:MAG: hypothetical protein IJE08_10170 [Clostridia bacterium]|nr:hypothetical protein [Clostridia bacterium]
MRQWIALLTALSLFLLPVSIRAEAADIPGRSSERNSSLALLSSLYEGQNTLVFSPLSLSVALGMALEGADGATREQLDAFLGGKAPGGFVLEDLRYSGAEMANAAFCRPDFTLLPDYADTLIDRFDADAVSMQNGSVMEQVNDWVNEHTGGLIDQFLPEEPDPLTKLLLVNALGFKANWASPFDPVNTGFSVFHAPEGDIEVSSMRQTSTFLYKEAEAYQSVILPYRNSALEMVVLLPKDGDIGALIQDISNTPDDFIREHLPEQTARVRLSLPNVHAESSFELKDALQMFGVTDAFSPDLADFSRMAENACDLDLHISSVLQKTILKVNETGTEAAAATQVSMAVRGAFIQEETVEMNVDRPFMMLVHDPASGYVLFAACINNPA